MIFAFNKMFIPVSSVVQKNSSQFLNEGWHVISFERYVFMQDFDSNLPY